MNIALFGGSFNPIHLGHIKLIKEIKKNFNIDKLILMPTAVSPHKSNSEMASAEHRYNMCSLAVDSLDYVQVSDLEIKRQGKSYTYLTIEDLTQLFPDDKLFLIMGADMFMSFESWKNFQYILSKVTIIAVPRDSVSYDAMLEYSHILKGFGGNSYILKNSVMEVSSSEIRELLNSNKDISHLIDDKVLKYIKDNNIYGRDDFE